MESDFEEVNRLCYQVNSKLHSEKISKCKKFFHSWSSETNTEHLDLQHLLKSIEARRNNLQERLSLHPRRRVTETYDHEDEIKDMEYVISQLDQQIQRKKRILKNLSRKKHQIDEEIHRVVDQEQMEDIEFDKEIEHKEKGLKLYHYLAPIHWINTKGGSIKGVLAHSEDESYGFEFKKGDDRVISNALWKKMSSLKNKR